MRLASARLRQINQHRALLPFSEAYASTSWIRYHAVFSGSISTPTTIRRRVSIAALQPVHTRQPVDYGTSRDSDGVRTVALVDRDGEKRPWAVEGRLGLQTLDPNLQTLTDPQLHGRWEPLLLDPARLDHESDFQASSDHLDRLVDHPEFEADIALWSCLFNFRQRRGDLAGAGAVWREVLKRRTLHRIDSLEAQSFWQNILKVALPDESFLESIWVYAEWMYEQHGNQWPELYKTILSYCMSTQRYDRALRWHIRLSAHFNPDKASFFNFLKQFLLDPRPEVLDTLRAIYVSSNHRQLYDILVPYLWSHGQSSLARSWRITLVLQNDKPASLAARPFLRFLSAYYPSYPLVHEERIAAGLVAQESDDSVHASKLREEVYRAHGATFGIKEKTYSDHLGAQWFASSWVSLDVAINIIHALGVKQIGPLSLQSIALRESNARGVRSRLRQLESMDISVGSSNYAKAIRQLATVDDSETLQSLLHSDLHPEVFDDLTILQELIESCVKHGDWQKYRVILTIRLALSMDYISLSSNSLLKLSLVQNETDTVLKVLKDMDSRGIQVLPSIGHDISNFVLDKIPRRFDPTTPFNFDFYISLCRQLADMQSPLSVQVWRRILFLLVQCRTNDAEQLCLEIVDRYLAHEASDRAASYVHVQDVPHLLRDQPGLPDFRILPRDLPVSHELHPVQHLFDTKLVFAIVQWSFRYMLGKKTSTIGFGPPNPIRPADFFVARGVMLLRLLKNKGVNVPDSTVRKAVMVCVSTLYDADSTRRSSLVVNGLSLPELKALYDEAWGIELLGSVDDMERFIKRHNKGKAAWRARVQSLRKK